MYFLNLGVKGLMTLRQVEITVVLEQVLMGIKLYSEIICFSIVYK